MSTHRRSGGSTKIELHCHTHPKSACGRGTPHEMLEAYDRAGYGVVCLTDHDTLWSVAELAKLQRDFPRIAIFAGLEKTLHNRGGEQHLLLIGTNDRKYVERENEQTYMTWAKQDGLLTILAHPLRWQNTHDLIRDLDVDAIEAYTNNQHDERSVRSIEAAVLFDRQVVNAGDAHGVEAVGRYWIEVPGRVQSLSDLRAAIVAGRHRCCDLP